MNKLNRNEYTLELNEVIDYMVKVLSNEFPTDVITLEYLILSILDIKDCHANLILDNCLMSDNIEELRKIYVSVLEKHSKPQLKTNKIIFSDDLIRLIELAKEEAVKLETAPVGSEHILLALLNKENEFLESEVFDKFRLEYDFIYNRCAPSKNDGNSSKTTRLRAKRPSQSKKQIPTKSQINTKAVSTKSSGSFEFIEKYTTNINKMVREGKIDDIVGREKEANEIIKVLSRRKKNNAILVGNGGCGKTAIVHGLAKMIENGKVPKVLEGKEIIMMNPMAIVSGTHFRGMFEERINGLFEELKKSERHILFIDDMHTMLKNGNKDKDTDISGMINEVLSEGTVRVLATTTFKDYRNSIENNSSLSRKLQKIIIDPTSPSDTINILQNNKKYYEEYHNVVYDKLAIEKAVELSERYITDRSLPDSAFDVIDLAGASTSLVNRDSKELQTLKKRMQEIENEKDEALNNGEFEKIDSLNAEFNVLASDVAEHDRKVKKEGVKKIKISENDIANIISEITKIPITKLTSSEKKKIANIDQILKESVVGQDEAIDAICKSIKRNRVGLGDKNRPLGVTLMCGKSGTGKTLIAKKLAEEIFGDEKALVRIDMSEYSEKNSVSKLTGAAPGYVGYENGGQLTEAIKHKKHCVLLLDEIEKADQEVYNVFLQLFDDGRLTDSSGQVVNFKNVIVLMTSNVGAKKSSELGGGLGFVTNEEANSKAIIEKELKKKFTPEFLNRISQIVYFNDLSNDNLKDIVKLEINKLSNRLKDIKYNIKYTDEVIDYIHSKAVEQKEFGARPIARLIQTYIEDEITELMLTNDYKQGHTFQATYEDGKIKVE